MIPFATKLACMLRKTSTVSYTQLVCGNQELHLKLLFSPKKSDKNLVYHAHGHKVASTSLVNDRLQSNDVKSSTLFSTSYLAFRPGVNNENAYVGYLKIFGTNWIGQHKNHRCIVYCNHTLPIELTGRYPQTLSPNALKQVYHVEIHLEVLCDLLCRMF